MLNMKTKQFHVPLLLLFFMLHSFENVFKNISAEDCGGIRWFLSNHGYSSTTSHRNLRQCLTLNHPVYVSLSCIPKLVETSTRTLMQQSIWQELESRRCQEQSERNAIRSTGAYRVLNVDCVRQLHSLEVVQAPESFECIQRIP